jgi:hypothetical protein
MIKRSGSALFSLAYRTAWAMMLFALPVTSFPYFPPAIGGEALVRPLSLYPLMFLTPFVVLPRLIRRPLPKNLLALLPFILVAIGASAISLLQGIEPALGIAVNARVLRGVFTLGIGCAFFLAISLLPDTVEDLRFSLRWIYAGLGAALLWGAVQAYNIISPSAYYFAFLEQAQRHISIRRLRIDRISGLTYEPHWFAEQIILLMLPYSLAAVLHNYTVFRWRWRRLTLEWLLLIMAIVILPFTFSRAGLLNLIITLVLTGLLLWPRNHRTSSFQPASRASFWTRRALEIAAVCALVITPIYFIGAKNPFFARIWGYWNTPNASLTGYLSYLGFDARLVYAQAAYNTYQAHPITGVGLGNYAFYFEEMLPYRPIFEVPEILYMVTPELGRDRLITSKNFYLRIMAETGILGAITFLVFMLVNLGYALYLRLSPEKEWKYWGTASLCGLIAFALSALTFDSFVIPNMWVVLGLITAATRVATNLEQPIHRLSEHE